MRALRLFKANNDTLRIAQILGVTEAEAYNMLAQEREQWRRQLAEARAARRLERQNRKKRRLIGFAGQEPGTHRMAK